MGFFGGDKFQTIDELDLSCSGPEDRGDFKEIVKIAKGFNKRVSNNDSFTEKEKLIRLSHGYKWVCRACYKMLKNDESTQKDLLIAFFTCANLVIRNLIPARVSSDLYRTPLKRKNLDEKVYDEVMELYDKVYDLFPEGDAEESDLEANDKLSQIPIPVIIEDE